MTLTTDEFITALPKAELHVHLEGALEADLRFRIAQRNDVEGLPNTIEEIEASYGFVDLATFLTVYAEGIAVLHTEQDYYDLTTLYLQRSSAENVQYSEIHFDPQTHTNRGVAFETVITGIHRAQLDAEHEFGIRSQAIMGLYGRVGDKTAAETLEESLPFKDWITAVGIYPYGFDGRTPPADFQPVVHVAREHGYTVTAHCNTGQPESLETIRECLEYLNLDRIDHGVDIVRDAQLIEEIRRRDLCITICPTESPNRPGPWYAEQVRKMLDLGLNVTVNSDDPAYFYTRYVGGVLRRLQPVIQLTRGEMVHLMENAFRGAWLPTSQTGKYLSKLKEFERAQT